MHIKFLILIYYKKNANNKIYAKKLEIICCIIFIIYNIVHNLKFTINSTLIAQYQMTNIKDFRILNKLGK